MEITLKFSHDEAYAAKVAMQSLDIAGAISEVAMYIRNTLKYSDVSEETTQHLLQIRDLLPTIEE